MRTRRRKPAGAKMEFNEKLQNRGNAQSLVNALANAEDSDFLPDEPLGDEVDE